MSTVDKSQPNKPEFNVIGLQNAVLCADCEVISESKHDICRVCGSVSLLSLSGVLGGTLPVLRAQLVDAREPTFKKTLFPLRRRMPHTQARRAIA